MAKQILVKTPLTTDGMSPVIGTDGRQVYTESILNDVGGLTGARSILEKRNQGLNAHLKVLIEDYEGPIGVSAPGDIKTSLPAQPTSADMLIAENNALKKQIAQLSAGKEPAKKLVKDPA